MRKIIYLLLIIVLGSCSTEQVEKEIVLDEFADCRAVITNYDKSMIDPTTGFIQGDIFPDKETFTKAYINTSDTEQGVSRLWTNNEVPFYLDVDLSNEKKNHILERIDYIESKTNIDFIYFINREELLKLYKDGVHFRSPTNPFGGNGAHIGRQGGIQNLTLVNSSTDLVIDHEIFHTLGHEHEHTRPDRDLYITINWENVPINPFLRKQFEINDRGGVACGNYDLESGMHYGSEVGRTRVAEELGLYSFLTIDGEVVPAPTKMSERDFEANKILYPKKV